jgi:hypothetical protein
VSDHSYAGLSNLDSTKTDQNQGACPLKAPNFQNLAKNCENDPLQRNHFAQPPERNFFGLIFSFALRGLAFERRDRFASTVERTRKKNVGERQIERKTRDRDGYWQIR